MKLVLLIIILIIGTVLSTTYLHEQGEKLAQRTKGIKAVHDCVHEYLPDLSEHYGYYNILLGVFAAPLILYIGKYNMWEFGISYLWLIVPVAIFRNITISASIPTTTTDDIQYDFGSWVKRHIFGSHHDRLYSGHLSVALCLILIMMKMDIIKNRKLWFTLLGGYGLFSAMSKQHYSIDLIIAVPVCLLFFDWTENKSASRDLIWG